MSLQSVFSLPFRFVATIGLFALSLSNLRSGPINTGSAYVPNASFESPVTDFAAAAMDSWQKAPEPAWYQGGNSFPWIQLMGEFANPSLGASNHIDNVDGNQAAFIFALPDVAIFQDGATILGTPETERFNARFEAGKSYALTVAVLGGSPGLTNRATIQISIFYRDAASNMITVAATTVTNSAALFPTNTHFLDFQARTPIVRVTDAWWGKPIGIRIASTVGFDLQGGYWDVDNVRLTESVVANGSFESPETDFAGAAIDSWQKSPQPIWYQGGASFPWDQLMGQFLNTPRGAQGHIDNVDGEQAAFLFSLPDVSVSQDTGVKFETGKSYTLTAALLGGDVVTNGATFEISIYYRDATSNAVTLTATTITNSLALFPARDHLLDFQARTPIVRAGDAWAGKNIGIRLASTVGFDRQGGYWDVDNVRLTESVVPNGSFESPETDFAAPGMDSWQKAPQPVWYPSGGMFTWDQLVGQFLNTPRGAQGHVDNIVGEQGAFIFGVPEVAISQELTSTTGGISVPYPGFSGKFEAGKSYALAAGILGGGGGMSNGTTFQISLYYRDAAGTSQTLAARTITNSPALFPANSHLKDFRVAIPTVKSGDAWAGRAIGVRLASTVGFDLQAGYWDVDNVQLEAVQSPILIDPSVASGRFQVTLESAQGRFEVLASTNIAPPTASGWTSLGTLTNVTGRVSFTDTNSNLGLRFYQVRQAP